MWFPDLGSRGTPTAPIPQSWTLPTTTPHLLRSGADPCPPRAASPRLLPASSPTPGGSASSHGAAIIILTPPRHPHGPMPTPFGAEQGGLGWQSRTFGTPGPPREAQRHGWGSILGSSRERGGKTKSGGRTPGREPGLGMDLCRASQALDSSPAQPTRLLLASSHSSSARLSQLRLILIPNPFLHGGS